MFVFLIGFRGSGKSTIGPLLATSLGGHWLDADKLIEEATGHTIPQLFEQLGEAGFREIEAQSIRDAILHPRAAPPIVLSTGGGAVMNEATRGLLKQHGRCIWLHAPAEILLQRIESDSNTVPRPALTDLDPLQEIRCLLEQREPVYADCADYDIDTSQFTATQVVDEIGRWWNQDDTS